MAIVLAELYDALLSAGASPEKARTAAERFVPSDRRFDRINADLRANKWALAAVLVGIVVAFLVGVPTAGSLPPR